MVGRCAVGDVKSYDEGVLKDKLFRHSSVMFISTIITGALGYFYQIYMGRALGPEQYSVFGALFAIFYLFMVVPQTISTTATSFVSKFSGEGKEIGFFLMGSLKRMAIIGLVVSTLFLAFSSSITAILRISSPEPVMVLSLVLFLIWIQPINIGALRGLQRFKTLGFVNISNAFFKLLFGVIFVTFGFGVSGALLGLVMGSVLAILISLFLLIPNFKKNNPHEPNFNYSSFYTYSAPVALAMFSLSVPANLDVVLAKYFFTAKEAGLYTSASVLGKIIFFFPGAVYAVMFPMVVEKHARGEDSGAILKKGLLYTGLLSGPVAMSYFLFPQIVTMVFGASYAPALSLVAPYGLAMFFFSLTAVIMQYHLAIKNLRYVVFFATFTVFEVILLFTFHSSTMELVKVLLGANFGLAAASLLYTWRWTK